MSRTLWKGLVSTAEGCARQVERLLGSVDAAVYLLDYTKLKTVEEASLFTKLKARPDPHLKPKPNPARGLLAAAAHARAAASVGALGGKQLEGLCCTPSSASTAHALAATWSAGSFPL